MNSDLFNDQDFILKPRHSAKDWTDFAKAFKDLTFKINSKMDMPPIVIGEKNGKVQIIAVAPQVDRNMGLHAANLLKVGADVDVLTLIVDARMKSLDDIVDGKIEHKNLQKLVEEGKREEEKIVDTVLCYRIINGGESSVISLPYELKEDKINWINKEEESDLDDPIAQGIIPDALSSIMKEEIGDKNIMNMLKETMKHVTDYSEERHHFHFARAMMSILLTQKYFVVDLISSFHPEWINGEINANKLLDDLVKEGFFPREATKICKPIIDQFINTDLFVEKMAAVLDDYSYWFPPDHEVSPEKMAKDWKKYAISPISISEDELKKSIEQVANDIGDVSERPKIGDRVRVWNGDRSVCLGDGVYKENAKVYFVTLPDGTIISAKNAEEEPVENVPEGGIVSSMENPKLVLDDGSVYYGCQVWWDKISEEPDFTPIKKKKQ